MIETPTAENLSGVSFALVKARPGAKWRIVLDPPENFEPEEGRIVAGMPWLVWLDDEQPPPTPAEIQAVLPGPLDHAIAANTLAVQAELDRQAQAKGYDNIVSACSYAAQVPGAPFQAEGAAFLRWRSAVWTHAYAVLSEVKAGRVPMPTPEEAVAQMPALELPA